MEIKRIDGRFAFMKPSKEMELLQGEFGKMVGLSFILVALVGGMSFAFLAPPYFVDQVTAISYTVGGLIGTFSTYVIASSVSKESPQWNIEGLKFFRRNTVIFLLIISWLIGAVTGFFICYVIPRQSA